MTDDLNKVAPEDPRFINTHQEYEISYWCKRFGCTRQALFRAIAEVGNGSAAVERYLKSSK